MVKVFVGDEFFVVMFGDDLMEDKVLLIKQLMNSYDKIYVLMLVVMKVFYEEVFKYGVINFESEKELGLYNVNNFVEKLLFEDVFSDFVIIGCYLLILEIFDVFEN